MISLELKEAYNNLDLNDKRSAINKEILVIDGLLKNINSLYGLTQDFEMKVLPSDMVMNENEYLNFLYENIFEIQKQILLITDILNKAKF